MIEEIILEPQKIYPREEILMKVKVKQISKNALTFEGVELTFDDDFLEFGDD